LKPRHLIPSIFGRDTGFEKPGSNGIQTGKFFTIAKECGATLDLAPRSNQVIDAIKFLLAQVNWHAQLAQVTVGAGDFDGLRVHVPHFGINLQVILMSVKFGGFRSLRVLTVIKVFFVF
jgi:hypothetical protein